MIFFRKSVLITRCLNRLLQRYQNVKKELENQQNLERIKVEKAFTRPGKSPQYNFVSSLPNTWNKEALFINKDRKKTNLLSHPRLFIICVGTASMSRSQTMNQSKMSYQSSSKLGGAKGASSKNYPASKPSHQ